MARDTIGSVLMSNVRISDKIHYRTLDRLKNESKEILDRSYAVGSSAVKCGHKRYR